jgi:hypothetical protein
MKKPDMYRQNKADPDGQIQRRLYPRHHKIEYTWFSGFCSLSHMQYYYLYVISTDGGDCLLTLLKLRA